MNFYNILCYLDKNVLHRLSTVRNSQLNLLINFTMTNSNWIDSHYKVQELESKIKLPVNKPFIRLFNTYIDTNYLKSEEGEELIGGLKRFFLLNENFICIDKNIGDKVAQILFITKIDNISLLNLCQNNMSDKGIELVSRCNLCKVERLLLAGNNITEKGIEYLVKCNFTKLNCLGLYHNKISDLGLKYLSQTPSIFSHLDSLIIGSNNLTDNGLTNFENNTFKMLKVLDLSGISFGILGLHILNKSEFHKNCEIYMDSSSEILNIESDKLSFLSYKFIFS